MIESRGHLFWIFQYAGQNADLILPRIFYRAKQLIRIAKSRYASWT